MECIFQALRTDGRRAASSLTPSIDLCLTTFLRIERPIEFLCSYAFDRNSYCRDAEAVIYATPRVLSLNCKGRQQETFLLLWLISKSIGSNLERASLGNVKFVVFAIRLLLWRIVAVFVFHFLKAWDRQDCRCFSKNIFTNIVFSIFAACIVCRAWVGNDHIPAFCMAINHSKKFCLGQTHWGLPIRYAASIITLTGGQRY